MVGSFCVGCKKLSAPLRVFIMLAVLVFPLAGVGALWMKAELNRNAGPVWQIKIAGFDPRDLLHGRFIQFQYDWNDNNVRSCRGKNCELCLRTGDQEIFNPVVTYIRNRNANGAQCETRIPHHSVKGLAKYFIPEEFANDLDMLVRAQPERFAVEINVPGGYGAPVVRDLLLDGIPIKDYVRNHGRPQKIEAATPE